MSRRPAIEKEGRSIEGWVVSDGDRAQKEGMGAPTKRPELKGLGQEGLCVRRGQFKAG